MPCVNNFQSSSEFKKNVIVYGSETELGFQSSSEFKINSLYTAEVSENFQSSSEFKPTGFSPAIKK